MKRILTTIALAVLLAGQFIAPSLISAESKYSFEEVSIVPEEEIIDGDYFAAGEKIQIDGEVTGDVYAAGGKIIVNGIIHGDLLVAGGEVTINGIVSQDVRAAAGDFIINGDVLGRVTAFSGNIEVNTEASVESIVAAAGDVTIFGLVNQGMNVAVGSLVIKDGATVNGDINYASEDEADISQSASISGYLQKSTPPQVDMPKENVMDNVFSGLNLVAGISSFIATLVLGLVLLKFFPRYSQNAANIVTKNLGGSMGIGLLALIISPILFILLLITIIGIPFSIILLVGIPLLLYIGRIWVILAIGNKVLKMSNNETKRSPNVAFIIGLVIYCLLDFIPIIGGLFKFGVLLAGLGAELMNRKATYLAAREAKIY